MAIRVDTSISLRSEYGVTFGKLLKASDKQLLIDTDTKFRPGTQVEFQLELKAHGVTVYGIAQVTRVTAAADGPSRYLMAITQFGAKDRRIYQEWLYELAQIGGQPSRPSAVVSSILSTRVESTAAPGGAAAPAPPPIPLPFAPQGEHAPTWSAGSSATGNRQGVGRAAVREALRARFAARGLTVPPSIAGVEPAPAVESPGRYSVGTPAPSKAPSVPAPEAAPLPPPRPPRSPEAEAEFSSKIHTVRPTRTAGGGAISITASPDAEAQFSNRPQQVTSSAPDSSAPAQAPSAPLRRLEVVVSTAEVPPVVSLKYNDPARYLADYSDYLSKGAAFVRWAGAKPDHRAAVSVAITLPSGQTVRCDGEVVALLPSGFGISLKFGESDRAFLSSEARLQG
ncbi:MAG: hypothetical protein ABIO70_01250 [Pseudomonadota bacterium]